MESIEEHVTIHISNGKLEVVKITFSHINLREEMLKIGIMH